MKKIPLILLVTAFFVQSYAQEETSLVFSQDPLTEIGSGSSVSAEDGQGYYATDDFLLEQDTEVAYMTFQGYQFADNLESTLAGVVLYIYEDDGGKPAGIPGKDGTPYYFLDLEATDSSLEMIPGHTYSYDFIVQTPELFVEANKTYWVVFASKINFETKLDPNEMWTWYNSTTFQNNDAMAIDPDDFFGSRLTFWLSIFDMTGGMFGDDVRGLSFSIYGEETTMAIDDQNAAQAVKLFPNPASEVVYFNLPQHSSLQEITIFDATGRAVLTGNADRLNVSALQAGTYYAAIKTTETKTVERFIKK